MKKIAILLLFVGQIIWANNLTITNLVKTNDSQIAFDVSWDNSWRISEYRDAVWLFVKYRNSSGQWQHLTITSVSTTDFDGFMPIDNTGLMIQRLSSNTGLGTVSGTVYINFDDSLIGPLPDFKVFGIEMVRVNEGAFYVGDGESNFSFYQGDDDTIPYYIADSNQITVGNTSSDIGASGLTNNIPATYPTGFDEFYMMKYEISQEQYVEFLNTLTAAQQQARTETDLTAVTVSNRFVMSGGSSPTARNGIACDANATNTSPITFYSDLNNNSTPNEGNDGQNVAPSYLSVNDCLAYLDWAALRPITDMEYEKAARGENIMPSGVDYANGTSLNVASGSIINIGLVNETVNNQGTDGLITFQHYIGPIRVGSLAFSTSTRLQSGAGFYGAMELTGNLIDLTVYTVDSNLSYTGNFGDGNLTNTGEQNNWNFNFTATKGGSFNNGNAYSVSTRNNMHTGLFNSRNYHLSPRGAR